MTRKACVYTALLAVAFCVVPSRADELPDKPVPMVETHATVRVKMVYQGPPDPRWPQNKPFVAVLPVPHKTADRAWFLSYAGSVLMTVADIENSVYALRQPGVQEASPLYGSHPSRGRYYAIAMPVTCLMGGISWKWKREDDAVRAHGWGQHKWMHWHFPNDLITGAHAAGVAITLAATGR